MRLIKISENEFINTEHVVKITFMPESENYKTYKNDNGDRQKEPTTYKSRIILVMSTGAQVQLDGLEADNLYKSITSNGAS
jgi:hypothetical protein